MTDSSVEIVPMEGIEPSEEIRELPEDFSRNSRSVASKT